MAPQKQADAPSLDETLQWINAKLAGVYKAYPFFEGEYSVDATALESRGCKVSVVWSNWQHISPLSPSSWLGKPVTWRKVTTFDLADVDEDRYKFWQDEKNPADTGVINFWSAGEKLAFEEKNYPAGDVRRSNMSALIVPVAISARVQNALRHAIKLCQVERRNELEKNSTVPGKREPF